MASDRLPPIGFWSYARQDDEFSGGKLSSLRFRVMSELQQQYGREPIKIFQDVGAIAPGAEWEAEIRNALNRSTFFIPIITPAFIESEWCCQELEMFLEREQELNRQHPELGNARRIFPVHYIPIQDIEPYSEDMLRALGKLQWLQFYDLRAKSEDSEPVRMAVDALASSVRRLLHLRIKRPLTPEEIVAEEAAAALLREQQAKAREEAKVKAEAAEAARLAEKEAAADRARFAAQALAEQEAEAAAERERQAEKDRAWRVAAEAKAAEAAAERKRLMEERERERQQRKQDRKFDWKDRRVWFGGAAGLVVIWLIGSHHSPPAAPAASDAPASDAAQSGAEAVASSAPASSTPPDLSTVLSSGPPSSSDSLSAVFGQSTQVTSPDWATVQKAVNLSDQSASLANTAAILAVTYASQAQDAATKGALPFPPAGYGTLKGEGPAPKKNTYVYNGQISADGQESGMGVETWSDGDKYSGQFKNNHMEGVVVMNFSDGNEYRGDATGGNEQAFGRMIYKGGIYYDGYFSENKVTGFGVYHFPDGYTRKGHFLDSKSDGAGVLYNASGQVEESGIYVNNTLQTTVKPN